MDTMNQAAKGEVSPWPDCPNCRQPVAANKTNGKPRKYCSDECMQDYPLIKKALGTGASGVPDWWPVCIHCKRRPRSVADLHQNPPSGPAVTEARRIRQEERKTDPKATGPTLVYKFCSVVCRNEFLAPAYWPDLLDDLREGTSS